MVVFQSRSKIIWDRIGGVVDDGIFGADLSKDRKLSVHCTLGTINAYYFEDYCKRMQRRKHDVVKEALLVYLKGKGVPVDMDNN